MDSGIIRIEGCIQKLSTGGLLGKKWQKRWVRLTDNELQVFSVSVLTNHPALRLTCDLPTARARNFLKQMLNPSDEFLLNLILLWHQWNLKMM